MRTVATALRRLRELRILNWVRRCAESWRDGRFMLEQETNAYAVLPESQWRGYRGHVGRTDADAVSGRSGYPGDRSYGQDARAGGQRHDAVGASTGLLPAQHPCARLVRFTGVHEMRRNTPQT